MKPRYKYWLVILSFYFVNSDAQYSNLHEFQFYNNAKNPQSIVGDHNLLFIASEKGVYKIQPDGSGFSLVKEFNITLEGTNPGNLVLSGDTIFGTTAVGGIHNYGTLFRMLIDGSGFQKILDFQSLTTGYYPKTPFITEGIIYGTCSNGGSSSSGTIYRVKTDGTDFVKLKDFQDTYPSYMGKNPEEIYIHDHIIYGFTRNGGFDYNGTIFSIQPDGTGFTKIVDLSNLIGKYPQGRPIIKNDTIYGICLQSNTTINGSVFKVHKSGNGLVKISKLDESPFKNCSFRETAYWGFTPVIIL